MRFLADENFPRPALNALRQAGFDVLWVAETDPGAADEEVLALSVSTTRTLLTFEQGFWRVGVSTEIARDEFVSLPGPGCPSPQLARPHLGRGTIRRITHVSSSILK